jgi:hypothetical protein
MAQADYQNVGTPRFYVNCFTYLEAIGGLHKNHYGDDLFSYLRLNPTKKHVQKDGTLNLTTHDGFNDTTNLSPWNGIAPIDLIGTKGFCAYLGHNMASCNAMGLLQEGVAPGGGNNSDYSGVYNVKGIVNASDDTMSISPQYDGWSLWTGNFSGFGVIPIEDGSTIDGSTMQIRWESGTWGSVDDDAYNGRELICNSIVIGNYYDMPFAPDSIKMSYDYPRNTKQYTKNGSEYSNVLAYKSPHWLGPAWTLQEGFTHDTYVTEDYANTITGRRTWDLSFTSIVDSKLYAQNLHTSFYKSTTSNWDFNVFDGDDFFSRVWNRTLGSGLKFIFQPDNNNNNPDQFAICKFKQNSLEYMQVSPNVYDVKLSIEEVW